MAQKFFALWAMIFLVLVTGLPVAMANPGLAKVAEDLRALEGAHGELKARLEECCPSGQHCEKPDPKRVEAARAAWTRMKEAQKRLEESHDALGVRVTGVEVAVREARAVVLAFAADLIALERRVEANTAAIAHLSGEVAGVKAEVAELAAVRLRVGVAVGGALAGTVDLTEERELLREVVPRGVPSASAGVVLQMQVKDTLLEGRFAASLQWGGMATLGGGICGGGFATNEVSLHACGGAGRQRVYGPRAGEGTTEGNSVVGRLEARYWFSPEKANTQVVFAGHIGGGYRWGTSDAYPIEGLGLPTGLVPRLSYAQVPISVGVRIDLLFGAGRR